MKINLKVRLKNKAFWVALIPALLLLVQQLAALFGFTIDLNELGTKVLLVVETVFVLLTLLGVVNDPTTAGVSDSEKALGYIKPGIGQEEDNDA